MKIIQLYSILYQCKVEHAPKIASRVTSFSFWQDQFTPGTSIHSIIFLIFHALINILQAFVEK